MKLRNPIAKELRTPKYKSKVVENKKKKLEDDDKHWITSGYEGTEILVKILIFTMYLMMMWMKDCLVRMMRVW